jgi:hypothetical protein
MHYDGADYEFPTNYGLGAGVMLPGTGLRIALDANFPSSYYKDVRLGAEYLWHDMVAVRAGYRHELGSTNDPLTGPTFGLGAGLNGMWMDYGYLISDNGEAQHRIALRLVPGSWGMSGGVVPFAQAGSGMPSADKPEEPKKAPVPKTKPAEQAKAEPAPKAKTEKAKEPEKLAIAEPPAAKKSTEPAKVEPTKSEPTATPVKTEPAPKVVEPRRRSRRRRRSRPAPVKTEPAPPPATIAPAPAKRSQARAEHGAEGRAAPGEDQGEERRHAEESRPLLASQCRGADDGEQPGVGEREDRTDAASARGGSLVAEISAPGRSSRIGVVRRTTQPPANTGPGRKTGPSCFVPRCRGSTRVRRRPGDRYSGNAPSNLVPSPIAIA